MCFFRRLAHTISISLSTIFSFCFASFFFFRHISVCSFLSKHILILYYAIRFIRYKIYSTMYHHIVCHTNTERCNAWVVYYSWLPFFPSSSLQLLLLLLFTCVAEDTTTHTYTFYVITQLCYRLENRCFDTICTYIPSNHIQSR